tara:strand:- start:125 stop:571 length:447 start_codon:yes stop_codon:yes gene_type:complete
MEESKTYNLESPIHEMLPHRFPFLLVDKVLFVNPFKSIRAQKNITINEPIFEGHFPNFPIYPGVYIIEGLAQTCGLLLTLSNNIKAEHLLTEIKQARFKKQVLPGDTVVYEVFFEKKKGSFFWFNGKVTVNSQIVASAYLSAYSIKKP